MPPSGRCSPGSPSGLAFLHPELIHAEECVGVLLLEVVPALQIL